MYTSYDCQTLDPHFNISFAGQAVYVWAGSVGVYNRNLADPPA